MKRFFSNVFASLLGTILAGVVLFFLMFIILGGIVSAAGSGEPEEIEEHTILALELNKKILDNEPDDPFANMDIMNMNVDHVIGLNNLLKNIKKAKEDDNIDGIFLKLSSINAGISTVEEIRNALIDFKESGKFIVSHSNAYSQKTYYLASVADEVYLTPEGGMQFVGLSAEVMFFSKMFKKFGVEPVIIRHGKFKSAVEPFMLEKMSEANREQLSTFINTIWNDMLGKIAESRNISVEKLNQVADELLLKTAKSCVEQGLVDSLKYYDQLLANLQEKTGAEKSKDLKFTSLSKYTKVPKKKKEGKKGLAKDKIAVIYASGEIIDGKGDGSNIGGESLSRTIRKVRNDDKIKAIVLRVNSPGGSALASEVIWREVKLAKETKPVIVSMGDYAASGGYYIACAADTILASANTLTGSIGVFGVLFNIEKLMNDKIGITTDRVNTNSHSDIGSATRKIKAEEEAYILTAIEDIYSTFTQHVADGRGMNVDAVDAIGQGRIWSGIKAKELGLVDILGGLDDAIAIAAEKAELERYRVVNYPKKKDPFQAFMEKFGGNIKASAIENELGEFAPYYSMFKNITNQKGVQARIPMEIYIN
jgi:protease IV